METTLHARLKSLYGPEAGGRAEVVVDGFRIDAVGPDGTLIEVQTGPLSHLRTKLARLLHAQRVRVIKPIVVTRRIVRKARRGGPDVSSRMSPKRGTPIDVFDDLVGLARLFPHPNLRIDVLSVAIDEVRLARRRRPGFAVLDRNLSEVRDSIVLAEADDLWTLFPLAPCESFTTRELATCLGRPMDFAQRVAYCLRLSGAAEVVGKVGNRREYMRKIKPESEDHSGVVDRRRAAATRRKAGAGIALEAGAGR